MADVEAAAETEGLQLRKVVEKQHEA